MRFTSLPSPGTWLRSAALLAALALCACGSDPNIKVDRSAALPRDAAARFVVIPTKVQDSAKDYEKYATQIAGRIGANGLTRVSDAAQARYGLMFSYDGDGMTNAAEERHRVFAEKKEEEGKIKRSVSVTLYDLTKPHQHDEVVFNAVAECKTERGYDNGKVIAALLDAALQDFPGKSRETFEVDLPAPQ